ncbi:MAG TPA: CCA tRNA nucleotidyltransferase [Firmicutes bacterium]|nr:CCA tRNA nucleotidyltransferase [Bacillota bacterium]
MTGSGDSSIQAQAQAQIQAQTETQSKAWSETHTGSRIETQIQIPEYVGRIVDTLRQNGYTAFIVGGAVRDALMGRVPKDWDVATDATPDEVERLFGGQAVPTGKRFGTMTVFTGGPDEPGGKSVEVTTFRADGVYSDGRRPDSVTFSRDILDDLARRDFTINAMAYDPFKRQLVDPYGGARDIARGRIASVGDPGERFREDALRMLRGIRLASELGFYLAPEVMRAAAANRELITNVSWERIRDELTRILISARPAEGIDLIREAGLLPYILPELVPSIGMKQGELHTRTVFEHVLAATGHIETTLRLRLAALLHDIGKPQTLSHDEHGNIRFPNHHEVGARLAREALARLRYPKEIIERVSLLVKMHMFYYDPSMPDKAVRRLVAKFGADFFTDLAKLREADRFATGTLAGVGQNMSLFMGRLEKVMSEGAALDLRDLAVNGDDVMEILGITRGPEVGRVLHSLLERVLEDPGLNTRDNLIRLIKTEGRNMAGGREVLNESGKDKYAGPGRLAGADQGLARGRRD